ncbi:MAG: AMP-binding protein [Deltaproteobacteria bacterium]|nr:AMP-binding protein [Deltaproteobacteria bacterium]
MIHVGALLETRTLECPDRVYLVCPGMEVSFSKLNERVDRTTVGLHALGVARGDRAALLVGNCPEFLYLWWGLWKLGAVMVPVNLRLTAREAAYIINHCGARVAVVGPECRGLLPELKTTCPRVTHWVSQGPEPPEGMTSVEGFLNLSGRPPETLIDLDAPASILYTSGTTGFPKGVVHSQANYLRTGASFAATTRLQPSDRLLTANPLYHVNAQFYSAMGTLCAGATFILMEKFSASRMWEWTKEYRANKVVMLLALTSILFNRDPRPDDAGNPVEVVVAGGAPKGHYRDFEHRFGVRLQTLYSLSESVLAVMGMPDEDCVDGAVGRPMLTPPEEPNLARVVDEQDREVSPGAPGEIVLRNSAMMKGYYESPEDTAQVLRGGWLHTGDRGVMDERGLLYFVGRVKDVIRKKGENISAAEVETVLLAHPSVAEVAVMGVQTADSAGEEEIQACVVWRPGSEQDWEALIAHCAGALADFKVPRLWQAWGELPKNSMNRVVKPRLKENSAEAGPVYDRRKQV